MNMHVNMPKTTHGELHMASPPVIEDPSHASRRAKVRIGVAITLLVTAIGILAVLNQHKTTTEPEPVTATPPVQESMSSQETEKPAEPEAPGISSMTSPPPPTTPPAAVTAPVTPPPPPPVVGKLPVMSTAQAPLPPPSPARKTAAPVVGAGPEPTQPAPKPAQAAAPARQAATPATEPVKAAAAKEFVVQLGVFSDMENAKQLQAKLAEHGIPSHTETRVQIGPFKTRAEADQAREKLKTLGLSGVIAPR